MQAWVATAGGDGLGTLWRIELLHPAVVHFSVALTVVGTLFWLLGESAGRWTSLRSFRVAGPVTLLLAVGASWAAVQTGFMADAEVGRDLYDPRPLKDHENLGLAFSWLLSVAVGTDLVRRWERVPRGMRRWTGLLVAVGLLAACGLLAYTAHLGAGLVYLQGAGVEMPAGY